MLATGGHLPEGDRTVRVKLGGSCEGFGSCRGAQRPGNPAAARSPSAASRQGEDLALNLCEASCEPANAQRSFELQALRYLPDTPFLAEFLPPKQAVVYPKVRQTSVRQIDDKTGPSTSVASAWFEPAVQTTPK